MYIKEIISLIEAYAPLKLQASFNNSGLLCGDSERELTSILLCIDVTEEVVKEAIDKGHNLIISHHPLIFSGLKHITPTTYVERCVIDAIKHDITIYAAHTIDRFFNRKETRWTVTDSGLSASYNNPLKAWPFCSK